VSDDEGVRVALARLEGKLDSLLTLHTRQSDDLDDHERRLRDLEASIHQLATRTDLEEIEAKRDAQMIERQRKLLAVASILIAVIVPIESAIIAALVQAANA
jgi:hypothetical protein